MFEQYNHLLIPEDADFVPSPSSVFRAFESLTNIDGIPRDASFRLGTLSGRTRKMRDAFTDETLFELPVWDYRPLSNALELPECLAGLLDYRLFLEGNGPADLPPFTLYDAANGDPSIATYGYSICLYLNQERFRLDEPAKPDTRDKTCSRTAYFRHPETDALIEVANAASARFWVALEFGRWVLPKIRDSLDVLNPLLLATFSESFGVRLVQGCSTY